MFRSFVELSEATNADSANRLSNQVQASSRRGHIANPRPASARQSRSRATSSPSTADDDDRGAELDIKDDAERTALGHRPPFCHSSSSAAAALSTVLRSDRATVAARDSTCLSLQSSKNTPVRRASSCRHRRLQSSLLQGHDQDSQEEDTQGRACRTTSARQFLINVLRLAHAHALITFSLPQAATRANPSQLCLDTKAESPNLTASPPTLLNHRPPNLRPRPHHGWSLPRLFSCLSTTATGSWPSRQLAGVSTGTCLVLWSTYSADPAARQPTCSPCELLGTRSSSTQSSAPAGQMSAPTFD